MKQRISIAIIFILVCLVSLTAQNTIISGKVLSQNNSQPIQGASITLFDKDSTIIIQSQTNEKGIFHLETAKATTGNILSVSFIGFNTEKIAVISGKTTSLNLGNIFLTESQSTTLQEVTVTADRMIRKVDKYIVIPQQDEVDRSSKAIELLDQIPLPGLSVDRIMQKISVSGGTPVLLVNGKERDINYFANLNPNKILRIEYNTTPGIRYIDRGNSGIINFILKEAEEGGSITAQFQSAFNTGFINGYFNGSYNYKKSQFSLIYNCGYRDYDKWIANSNEKFIGDNTIYIERNQRGINSPMYYFDNNITADYTYMHSPNTMLVVNFNSNFCPSSGGNDGYITETRDNLTWKYDRVIRRKNNSYNPTLDIFFSKKMNGGHTIELNAVTNLSNGYSQRNLWYNYDNDEKDQHIPYETDNNGWSFATEAVYGKEFEKITTRFGVQYLHNYAENDYKANDSFSKMKKDNTYFYGELTGNLGKVNYNLGSGMKILNVNDYTDSRTFVRNLTTATLQLQAGKNWSLRYNFNYTPSLPSLSQLSPIISQVDDITYSTGNPDLKPSELINNTIRADFQSGKFTASLSANYQHQFNPIISFTRYDNENNQFIYTRENGNYWNRIRIGGIFSYKKILNHFNISVTAYFNRFNTKGRDYDYQLNNFNSNLNIQAYFGKWYFGLGQCLAANKYLNGNNIGVGERMSQIYAQYKYRNLYFAAMWLCPFQNDGYKYETTHLSKVNPGYTVNWTKNNGNMVILSISYQANFGKSFKKNHKTLNNGSYDNGMVQ